MAEFYEVISNKKIALGQKLYAMTINAPKIAQESKPGQFVHIKCESLTLRRPISIATTKPWQIVICYDVRGEGTAWMAALQSGDKIDVLGPLGNGFDLPDPSKKLLFVGGGIGIYPLYFAAEVFSGQSVALLGFKSKAHVSFESEFAGHTGETYITTDDGSYGKKGFVTDMLKEILDRKKIDMIMACGPKPMMKAVSLEAAKRNICCQVSLEERMGCGVGACLACVCKINGKNKRICADGPVFWGDEVDWEWGT